jgi:hypothetical protein
MWSPSTFNEEGGRMQGTIARIFSDPLRFQFKTSEGDLLDETHDIFTTAQHMLAAAIDKTNGGDGVADILAMASKARKMVLYTKGPVPNHMTNQMNREMTPHDYDMLQSLESMPGDRLKLGLGQLSSGKQLTFLRFIYKTSISAPGNVEFAAAKQAHAVSLNISLDCNGVVLSAGQILKLVYFAFDKYSIQDLAPATTFDTSATASTSRASSACCRVSASARGEGTTPNIRWK